MGLGWMRRPSPTTAALVLLLAVTFVLSLVLARSLFPLYSINHDDAMYVYEARLLSDGDLTLPAAEHDVLRPWASGVVGDRLVMKYTPPWPAVLAAGQWAVGSMRVAVAAVAATAVGLVYLLARAILGDRRVALGAAATFALSPITVIQSGTFLPYLFQLATGLGFAVALLAGVRHRSGWLLAGAGAAFGVGLFARPFDAVLFALPFGAAVAWQLRRRPGELARTALAVAAGAAPVVALDLLYNAHTMGGPLTLPFTVTGPYDTMGFGRRGVFPDTTFDFSLGDGWSGLTENLRWFPSWSFGGIVTFLLAGLALVAAARSRSAAGRAGVAALVGVAVAVCAGYTFFWSPYAMSDLWPGVQTLGPFYHLAVLVPVAILGARGLDLLWRGGGWRRPAGVAAVVVGVGLTIAALPPKLDANADVHDDFAAAGGRASALRLTDAVLVMPARGNQGFLSPTPFLENRPDLDQPVLYAEDRQARNIELFDRFAGRSVVQLVQQLEPGDEMMGPSLVPTALRRDDGESLRLDLRVTNPVDRPHAVAYIADGERRQERQLDDASRRGDAYEVSWDVAATDPGDGRAFAPTPSAAGLLTVGVRFEDETGDAAGAQCWERRLPYRTVDGHIQLVRPGLGFELFAYGDTRQWLPTNIDPILAEAPAP